MHNNCRDKFQDPLRTITMCHMPLHILHKFQICIMFKKRDDNIFVHVT
jgi:hypothetical protein